MKRYFITVLFVSLFVMVSFTWAEGDNKKTKTPAKVENAEKKTTPVKGTTTSCCCEMKASCNAKSNTTTDCCMDKKEVSSKTVADCCTNKTAVNETKKSSGKKTD